MEHGIAQNQSNARHLRGKQDPEEHQDHRGGLDTLREESQFFGDEPIGTDRAILTGDAPRRRRGIRPGTHGGTLRCLIADVQSQRRTLSRRIERYQEEITELQEEMFRQKQREKTLVDLLENWQRNVAEITDQGD